MKDSTKNKLKKIGKIGAYVLGIAFALCAGLVVGKCSADSVNKKAESSQRLSQSKSLAPKLTPQGVNLLDLGTKVDGYFNCHLSADGNMAGTDGNWVTYVFDKTMILEGATYVITYDGGNMEAYFETGSYFNRCLSAVARPVWDKIIARQDFLYYDDSLVSWVTPIGGHYYSPFAFSVPAGTYVGQGSAAINRFVISCPYTIKGLYLADSEYLKDIPSVVDISLSESSWFPYQWLGENNSPVIVGPYHSTMDSVTKSIGNILFESNGRLFKGINIDFVPVAQVGSAASQQRYPSTFGYYNQDMTSIWVEECHSDYLWYIGDVRYVPVEGGANVNVGKQRCKQFSDSSQSVTQYFDWVDKRYAKISVKWAGDGLNSTITTGSLTDLQWLEAVAQSVFDETISLGGNGVDVFSVIGNGFQSVCSILNLQILPFLTLGTLLLAPLVIIIALAILKVLNK